MRRYIRRNSIKLIKDDIYNYLDNVDKMKIPFLKTIVNFKTIVFFNQSYKKRSHIVFLKMIVFKNDCYSFSNSAKRMGRFQKRSFFCENETIVFENDRLTKQKTIVKRSFSKTINNPTYRNTHKTRTFSLLGNA